MKVLVISHMYPSAINPTYGIFVHKQVNALKNQGCEVKVVSPVPFTPWPLPLLRKKWEGYANTPRQDFIAGLEILYPRYFEFPGSLLMEYSGFFMYLGLRKLINRIYETFPFELIHAHVALPDGQAANLLQKKYKVPTVITVHGQDFQSTIYKSSNCRKKLFATLNSADKIITVSTKLKNIVQDQPFSSKITVVNNGINPGDCHPDISPDIVLNGKRIISISNLKKTKGIDLNLGAISYLVRKYPDLEYYIIGDGEERNNLEDLRDQLNLKDNVFFLGEMDHSQAMQKLAEVDIFSLPSWQEGFGVAYIEAMSQGKPVIGVQGEGIYDVVDHGRNGLLVQPQDVDSVINALDTLLSDPALAKSLGEAGRKTVLEGYTWEQNARKTVEVYKQLLYDNIPNSLNDGR